MIKLYKQFQISLNQQERKTYFYTHGNTTKTALMSNPIWRVACGNKGTDDMSGRAIN